MAQAIRRAEKTPGTQVPTLPSSHPPTLEAMTRVAASSEPASHSLRHRLLMWMVTGPLTRPVNPIVLACGPGEWHEGGLLILGVLLRREAWPVAYLGQSVPFPDLAEFVETIRPPWVVLIVMCEERAQMLAEWPHHIKQTLGRPEIAFGGRVFVIRPELVPSIPGYYLGDTFQEGIAQIERLLS